MKTSISGQKFSSFLCLYFGCSLVPLCMSLEDTFTSRTERDFYGSQNHEKLSDFLVREIINRSPREIPKLSNEPSTNTSSVGVASQQTEPFNVHVTAIHIDQAEFPLSRLIFGLTLELALEAVKKRLEQNRVSISLSLRSASTCSRQYAGAVAAEEYFVKRSRVFIVSGCDDAIRSVSQFANHWQLPLITAAGFGADLNDKLLHRTLIKLAFSFKSAVEFLLKILKTFNWKKINLITDDSDTNSLSLKEGIEMYFLAHTSADFHVHLNVISLDFHSLLNTPDPQQSRRQNSTRGRAKSRKSPEDDWPNQATKSAVHDCLVESSHYSRVSILLIPQQYLRKFMLSVYDQNMANGMYTFINIPLLLLTSDDQLSEGRSEAISDVSVVSKQQQPQLQQQTYSSSIGENVFIWRSLLSSRNAQAKQAYESLMSIYLKTPTSKAYVYFASKLLNLANSVSFTGRTISSSTGNEEFFESAIVKGSKLRLDINPYTASFYDCLQVYLLALEESLKRLRTEYNSTNNFNQTSPGLHARIPGMLRKRRFENMVTGTVQLNEDGDRENDYTLDDMNQMTGKYNPVILFKGETHDIERISRISWSSDSSVGPTIDNVDCVLTNTCASKPYSKFLITFMIAAAPIVLVMGIILYLVYTRINLESQLVDYWWKISYKDIEIVPTRRKLAGDSAMSETTYGASGSQVGSSSHVQSSFVKRSSEHQISGSSATMESAFRTDDGRGTHLTKTTGASTDYNSAADVCYGSILLGMHKLSKVALKPISKLHQSRKLMIELRTLKNIDHNNLCRFVGIVVDEGYTSIVTDYCSKGSLREFFQNDSMVVDWTFKYSMINDIVAGLAYLHSSPIQFHGRLKTGNCLVSSRFVVKLSDYGLNSLRNQIDEEEDDQTLLKKLIWRAPEHLKSGSKGGSKKGDVYSLGLVFYEITSNRLPFYDMEQEDYIMPLKSLHDELKSGGITEKTSLKLETINTKDGDNDIEPLINLIKECLLTDFNKRPSLLVVSTALKKITHGVTSKKLLENLTSRMEQYTNNLESIVDAKLADLLEEKLKAEELLYQFVPKSIAYKLKDGETVEPEAFECATVLLSDIVGFTSLSSESTPIEVIDFLSELYLCFDETLAKYDIFKVETIGDAYILASGLPISNEGKHVLEICQAALELRDRLSNFKVAHKPGRKLQMRVGVHSGPCIAGIVGGVNTPKYCVFGDTLQVGKFMESSGLPMKIHITEQSKALLDRIGGFKIEARTPKIAKDGLPFQTYWLEKGDGSPHA